MSDSKPKAIFYDTLNILLLPSIFFNHLLKRKIYFYRLPSNLHFRKILIFTIKFLNLKKINFLNKNPKDYINTFDTKFQHVNNFFKENLYINKTFKFFVKFFQLEEYGKKKLETLIKHELYKNNIDKDYASLPLIENLSKKYYLIYYPSNLSTFLILKDYKKFQISKLLIFTSFLIEFFNLSKKINFKFFTQKKNSILPESNKKCDIGFIPHKEFTYGNSFKKNYLFNKDNPVTLKNENILNIFFDQIDKKTQKYLRINKLNFKVLNYSKFYLLRDFFFNFTSFFNIFIHCNKNFYLSLFFIKIFLLSIYANRLVKTNLHLKKIFFHYDVLVSPYFNFALHLNSIKTFAVQERAMQYLYFKFYFFDHYFIINKSFINLLNKSGYFISNYEIVGFARANYGKYLLNHKSIKDNFDKYPVNFFLIGLLCCTDDEIGSYGEDGTSIKSNINFLKLIDELSDIYSTTGIHVSFKDYSFLSDISFKSLYEKLKTKNNVFFCDNKYSNIYMLATKSNLIISKYSSIVDEMLSIGKKVLIDDTEQYITNFNYYLSKEPICISTKKRLLSHIKEYKIIDFSKYENSHISSFEGYYKNLRKYINDN